MKFDGANPNEYFQVTCPMPGLYRLKDPRGVFLTFIEGEKQCFLADTGMGVGNVPSVLRSLTGKPVIAANTHGHIDHAGGNYQFETVWLAQEDHSVLKEWVMPRQKNCVLHMEGSFVPGDFDETAFLSYDGDNLSVLEAGQSFDLGNLSVVAIPLPAHTRGSMGFLCPELGVLLTGDSISTITYLVFPESCSVPEYIQLLETVRTLPFCKMLSSHQAEMMDKEHLDRFLYCVRSLEPKNSIRFRNPLFPEYRGNMYINQDACCPGGYAALVYTDDKLK